MVEIADCVAGGCLMNGAELVLRNYRLRVKVRVKGEDTVVDTEIRKVRAGRDIGKKGSMYQLRFGDVEVEMGEDLTADVVEILLYMLPEEVVQKMMEEYCERRLKWI